MSAKPLLAISLLLVGCSGIGPGKLPEPPTVSVMESGEVKLDGQAKTPAKVVTNASGSNMPIPEGSTFVFNEKLGTMTLTVSKATNLAVNRKETQVDGPVAFDPPKQPTASEIADAKSDYWVKLGLYACVLLGGAASIFGLVKSWNLVMYGGLAVLVSGLFGLFVQRHPLLLLAIGLGLALKFAGPFIWHTKLKHHVGKQPSEDQ